MGGMDGRQGANVLEILRRKTEVGMINRVTLAFAGTMFAFAFILTAYGLYQLFGELVIYAAAASIVVGVLIYLFDALTTPKPLQ